MDEKKAESIVITCIDFRFQGFINEWIAKNLIVGSFDRGAFAGAGKNKENILKQVEVAYKLHNIEHVIIINHEDCGAYGEEDDPFKHAEDLRDAKELIQERFEKLKVRTYYITLKGEFEQVN